MHCHEQTQFRLSEKYRQDIVTSISYSYLLGKHRSSLEAAKDAYRINSNDYELFYILGKISMALGDPKEAINNFKNSINKEPNEESYIELAKFHM